MKIQNGFTLVELMTVLVVMGVVSTMAIPGMNGYLDTSKLRGSGNQFFADVQFARSEAIKRRSNISVSVTSNGSDAWCYGLNESAGCDCTVTDTADVNACTLSVSGTNVLKTGTSQDFSNINLVSPSGINQTYATFDPTRGIALSTGTIIFQSDSGRELQVGISILGKVSVCSPEGVSNVSGYLSC